MRILTARARTVLCAPGWLARWMDYWLAIQLCVLLSKAHYAPAQPAILAFLRDTSIEDAWTNAILSCFCAVRCVKARDDSFR